ncbi:MAG: hypothetical protein R2724_32375 [Bryobacterales bacterium]
MEVAEVGFSASCWKVWQNRHVVLLGDGRDETDGFRVRFDGELFADADMACAFDALMSALARLGDVRQLVGEADELVGIAVTQSPADVVAAGVGGKAEAAR